MSDCLKKQLTAFCLLAISFLGSAQEEFVPPPARLLSIFPFRTLTGGVVLLRAGFGDHADTLNFILDTGSGGISLDSATVVRLGREGEASDKTIRGIGGTRKVDFIYNEKLRLPGLTVDSLNFHINNYDILTAVYGEQIDGIIGYSFLSRYIVYVNYDSSQIYVYSPGTFKYKKGGYMLRPYFSSLVVTRGRVRDERTINSRFLYDMGAGLCLLLSKDFVEDSSLLRRKRKLRSKEAEGVAGKVDMKVTVVRDFRLGPYRFRKVPTYIFEDESNITSYPYLGGILGNDILRRFNAVINYPDRVIHLVPNSHFNDLFDYSYSGIELYYLDETIVIGDVAEGSPAEKIGLKEGDIVVAVDRIFNQNLQEYKTALQQTGKKVQVVISRNGELQEFNLKIKSILDRK